MPRWAKGPGLGGLTHARLETVDRLPAFRDSFRERRCLIPSTGFSLSRSGRGKKQPFLLRRKDGQPFAVAGIWDSWRGSPGTELGTCAIITVAADELVVPVQERMPLILDPSLYDSWLKPELKDVSVLKELLQRRSVSCLEVVPSPG